MNTSFARKTLSLKTLVAVICVLLGPASASLVVAAPPEPTDCSAETYNDLASKNCGIEAVVPDTYWEASQAYVTIEQSTDQVHNGTYAMKVAGTSSWGSGRQGAQTIKTTNSIPVTAGSTYSYVAWVYIPSTATRVTGASLRVAWYAAADCSGSQLSTNTADISTLDNWTYGWLYTTAPATAQCAQLRLMINAALGTESVGPVYFDNAMFYDSNANAVTFSGLNATSPFAALALGLVATTGLVVLRKRK